MRIQNIVFTAAILSAAFDIASAGDPLPTSNIIAQAGAETVSSADVRSLLSGLPAAERAAAGTNLNALEQMVRAELVRKALLSEARAKGFEHRPETVQQLDRLRDDALVRLWVASQSALPADYPGDDDIKAAYEANKAALAAPTEYRLAQIFIGAPDGSDAVKTLAALRKAADIAGRLPKADFSQLAQEQSEHAESAAKGGDMGYLPDNKLQPEIAQLARSMKPGETIGPVKTAQGLHFLKLLDRKAGAVPSLAESHDRLAQALRARHGAELQQSYIGALNTRLGVTVNQIELARIQPTLK